MSLCGAERMAGCSRGSGEWVVGREALELTTGPEQEQRRCTVIWREPDAVREALSHEKNAVRAVQPPAYG